MAAKKRGLGRGLDALLGGDETAPAQPGGTQDSLRHLGVEVIRRSRYQPRENFDSESLRELADSIRSQGVVQPVVVRPLDEGGYELIAGERRWRAAQLAGLREIPVVVREVPEQAAMAMALIENIQREDLNPLEEARALDRLKNEFGLTHQEVADAVGRSRAAVSNLLRLIELTDEVKAHVEAGALEMGHARALLALKDAEQSEAAREVVARGLSVRETENLVRRWETRKARKRSTPRPDPDIQRLQDDLSQRLGASVSIKDTGGRGRVVIQYHSLDELDGILGRIH
ncbi:MAG TPA: ParB/RepB/Spo0J family partition protein [Gammaproteobacteria bacterium]|nr:ParB/RepB/Spo0J family partition protein [Gammaproteobacteria bacterium]